MHSKKREREKADYRINFDSVYTELCITSPCRERGLEFSNRSGCGVFSECVCVKAEWFRCVCLCAIASVWTAFTRSILLISSEVTDPFWISYDSQGTWWWRDWFRHRLVSSVWIRPWSSDTAWFNLCSYVRMIPPIWSDAVWFHPFGLIREVPILCGLLRAVTSVRFRPCGFDTSITLIGSYAVTRIFRGVYS